MAVEPDQPTAPKTATVRGVRTFFQTVGGVLIGLVVTVLGVPGVSDAIVNYAKDNFLPLFFSLAALIGLPAGIISWIQNRMGK